MSYPETPVKETTEHWLCDCKSLAYHYLGCAFSTTVVVKKKKKKNRPQNDYKLGKNLLPGLDIVFVALVTKYPPGYR